jgi:hypothetical protein
MTFIHPLLLAGLVLAGIPVLIHLIMQQKPKHLLFPAFRFLLQRHRTNQRKLRLRHLLLLALRIALIAGICLALARPRLFSQRLNLTGDSPVAVVLLFDTSYSMEYRIAERTRLDEGRRRANELLDELPEGSKVAVLDSAEIGGEWVTSLSRARDQVAQLKLRHANAPVTRQIAQAYRLFDALAQESDESAGTPPRFLYIFSDRTPESWADNDVQGLQPAPAAGINAVFVDVGTDKPADVAITELELPHQVVGTDDRIEVRATVQATGIDADTSVTCTIDGRTPGEQRPVQLRAGESRKIAFEQPAEGLTPGPHRIEVRLANSDSLPFDDVRFATVEVRAGRKVLAVADNPKDARIWRLALDTAHNFHCDVLATEKARKLEPKELLARYKTVCLIDVNRPDSELWAMLEATVQKGGRLAVVPGADLDPESYNKDAAARRLLPAEFRTLLTSRDEAGTPWKEDGPPHLFLAPFRDWKRTASVDFYKPELLPRALHYWEVAPVEKGGTVIVTYADRERHAALVERAVGEGRVLLFTTGFDGRRVNERAWWNNYLETGSSFYPVLVNLAMGYLAGDLDPVSFNFISGQPVLVSLPPEAREPLYSLEGPGLPGTEASIPRQADQAQLQITQAVVPGNFTVRDGNGRAVAGFSVNVRSEESQLTRDPDTVKKIETLLGQNTVLPVGHATSLRTALQGHWRQPLELFPWLMICLLLTLAFENLLANKFYRRPAGEA